jgi:hypothetical protein
MAKATAKNVKLSLNQREKLIFLLPSITSSFDKQKGEVISWSSAGKMGFRGSKRTLHTPKWQQRIVVKVLKQDLKVKVYVKVQETDVSLLSDLYTMVELK